MQKNLMMMAVAMLLSACHSTDQNAAFPAEFLGADYILSEQDAKQWALHSQQAEQCIYPNLTRIQREHFTKEDAYIHAQYVLFYPLEKIIGEQYVKMIQDDEKSMGYAQQLFKKYKNEPADPMKEANCLVLRKNAKDDLAVIKGQYKSGMVEEAKSNDSANPDGVATNQNKFFFDIIKWGTLLLL